MQHVFDEVKAEMVEHYLNELPDGEERDKIINLINEIPISRGAVENGRHGQMGFTIENEWYHKYRPIAHGFWERVLVKCDDKRIGRRSVGISCGHWKGRPVYYRGFYFYDLE